MITLKLVHPQAAELAPRAAALVTELTARILGKQPNVTAVAVEMVPASHWFVAGRALADSARAGFFLEVRITEGTNTKAEKEQFILLAFAGFRELLGDLEPESYVHLIEARADAYGYGGRTQERRFIEGRTLGVDSGT